MLLKIHSILEDFEISHSDVLNTTHTVTPFHAALQHRPDESQLQSQDIHILEISSSF